MNPPPFSIEPAGACGIVVAVALPLLRDGLARLLDASPYGPAATAATLAEAEAIAARRNARLLLIDAELLRRPRDLETLCARLPGLRTLALTPPGAPPPPGAHAALDRTCGTEELARAIDAILAAGRTAGQRAHPLTGRQRDVLRLLAEGRSTKDIARTLDLAVSTIKVHLAAVYRTFGARNRVEALCRAGALVAP